jgi:hypothetical protein
MNKAPSARWYSLWRSPAARQDDWADLGTAFGLDLSMGPDAPATPAPTEAKPRSTGWVRRLTTRRRAPA